MTAAEKLTKQGEEKGRQQGLEEGLKEGLKEGQATLLLRLLALRFGAVPVDMERRGACAPARRQTSRSGLARSDGKRPRGSL